MKGSSFKIPKFLSKYYTKYYNIISLNKDLILSGIIGFITNLVIMHIVIVYSKNSFTNSALTVIIGYIVSKIVFTILFQRTYRKLYTNKITGKIEWPLLKKIIMKMVFATFIFDFIDNGAKFIFMFIFLDIGFVPFQTVIISTIISSALSYLSINVAVNYLHVFRKENKKSNNRSLA